MNTHPAPYPSETRSKGWRFELDLERIRQSDTWALASPEVRPWLFLLWATAWEQVPCGSLPNDDALICARIGMTTKAFTKVRSVLLRGWWAADDGRLYHDVIASRVMAMLEAKRKESDRKAAYRAKMDAERAGSDTKSHAKDAVSHGTTTGQTPDGTVCPTGCDATGTSTGTGTGTGTGLREREAIAIAMDAVGVSSPAKPKTTDPNEIIFGYGVPLLVNAGTSDKQARSFLGGLRKTHGDSALVNALRGCVQAKPLQPLEWLAKALPPPSAKSSEEVEAARRAEKAEAARKILFGSAEVFDA